MKKRFLVLVLLACCLVPSAFAGGSKEAEQEKATGNIQILLGATAAATMDDPEYASLVRFKETLEKATTSRKVKVLLFPANQLGKINEIIEGVSLGTTQACQVGFDSISAIYKPGAIFSLPYLYRDIPHMQRVLASKPGKDMLDKMSNEIGLSVVSVLYRGPRHLMNSARPVSKPEDMKGLKIRTPANPLNQQTVGAMGATPVAIDFSEIYTALATKVVDGYENPIDVLYNSKGYETCKFLSLTGHMQSPIPIFINTKFYNGLPADVQQAVMSAGKAAENYRLELLRTSEGKALDVFKKAGVQVNEVDFEAFRNATKDVYKALGITDELYRSFASVQ